MHPLPEYVRPAVKTSHIVLSLWLCVHRLVCSSLHFIMILHRIGRHSKSLDTQRFVCALCTGQLVLLTPSKPRAPTPFANFVKENYGTVRQELAGQSHAEVMRKLSADFSKTKLWDLDTHCIWTERHNTRKYLSQLLLHSWAAVIINVQSSFLFFMFCQCLWLLDPL